MTSLPVVAICGISSPRDLFICPHLPGQPTLSAMCCLRRQNADGSSEPIIYSLVRDSPCARGCEDGSRVRELLPDVLGLKPHGRRTVADRYGIGRPKRERVTPSRICAVCGERMSKRYGESPSVWLARNACSIRCGIRARFTSRCARCGSACGGPYCANHKKWAQRRGLAVAG